MLKYMLLLHRDNRKPKKSDTTEMSNRTLLKLAIVIHIHNPGLKFQRWPIRLPMGLLILALNNSRIDYLRGGFETK